ncbi:MAG: TetR/AcrR family transcriptional regulator [Actinoplanes sp.]
MVHSPAEPASPMPKRPGRKRDNDAEDRILRSAVDVFTAEGWRGFRLDAVAKAAGVGKSTIYLRYPTREVLLLEVLDTHGYAVAMNAQDHGSVRADLSAFAHTYAEWLEGPAGLFNIRLVAEIRLNPDLAEVTQAEFNASISHSHQIVRRAKRRGEVPPRASSALILDTVIGTLTQHVLSSPGKAPYASPAGRKFVDDLVEMVLRGVGVAGLNDSTPLT